MIFLWFFIDFPTSKNLKCHFFRFLQVPICQGASIESLVSDLKTLDADLQRSAARALYDLCVGKDATALRHKQQAAEAIGPWGWGFILVLPLLQPWVIQDFTKPHG
jgi:hypothetical protein